MTTSPAFPPTVRRHTGACDVSVRDPARSLRLSRVSCTVVGCAMSLMLAAPGAALPAAGADAASPQDGGGGAASSATASAQAVPSPGSIRDLSARLAVLREGLTEVERLAAEGHDAQASTRALRLYLDHYEAIEALYGAGGPRSAPSLSPLVAEGEAEFHRLMSGGAAPQLVTLAASLTRRLDAIERAAREAGVPLGPLESDAAASGIAPPVSPSSAATAEIRWILEELTRARAAYENGRAAEALAGVEEAYLEGVEPLEPRLPGATVKRIESLIHLQLRPQVSRGAAVPAVQATFTALDGALLDADEQLERGSSSAFGAFNAFVIIVREGLEAVLLIAAILAYLSASDAGRRHRRRVYLGAGLGVAASFATWVVAQTVIPVSGASRELIEGITALVAVLVLLYVSHWLFQKTYIHDWKRYLREHVGRAVTTGSGLAMAGLAFAAVFREGFETVLFYQALLYDAGPGAVVAGFVPGMLLISVIGFAIVRLGLKLPLRTVFAVTNGILLYLAFVFLGKGLYNLQEAGLFAPLPISWLPDSEALRQIMGLYPVAQTLLAQMALLVTLGLTYMLYRRRAAAAAATVRA